MNAISDEPEQHPVLCEVVERRDRDDGGDAGGDRHRDGEDVVDEQRRAGDERRVLAEVLAADDVAAAAARVGEDRLAVRRDDDRRAGSRPRSRSGSSVSSPSARLDAPTRDDEEDLLGRVRGRRDGVGREDRERDRLRDPLVLLLGRGERPADQDPLDERHAAFCLPGPTWSSDQLPSAHAMPDPRGRAAVGDHRLRASARLGSIRGVRGGRHVHVVVVGCGRVGSELAVSLEQLGSHRRHHRQERRARSGACPGDIRRRARSSGFGFDRDAPRSRPASSGPAPSPRSPAATTPTSSPPGSPARTSGSSASSPGSTTPAGP